MCLQENRNDNECEWRQWKGAFGGREKEVFLIKIGWTNEHNILHSTAAFEYNRKQASTNFYVWPICGEMLDKQTETKGMETEQYLDQTCEQWADRIVIFNTVSKAKGISILVLCT